MKNNVFPCKPQFYYIKVGFKGVKLYRRVFVAVMIYFLFFLEISFDISCKLSSKEVKILFASLGKICCFLWLIREGE